MALNHLGLLGANNYMVHGKDLATSVGQSVESDAIGVGMNEGVANLLPNIMKLGMVEDRQASSKALMFLPMLLKPIGDFAMGLGDIGVDAAIQKEGLYSVQQQNKFGGVNHDSSGKAVYTDANGTVIPKPKLSLGQMAEKLGTETGIRLGTQALCTRHGARQGPRQDGRQAQGRHRALRGLGARSARAQEGREGRHGRSDGADDGREQARQADHGRRRESSGSAATEADRVRARSRTISGASAKAARRRKRASTSRRGSSSRRAWSIPR